MKSRSKFLLSFILGLVIFALVLVNINYPTYYDEYVNEYSKKYNVEPSFIYAVIKQESRFNKFAVSNKGALGLMQIMEPTAAEIAQEISYEEQIDLYDPKTNIELGTAYLARLKQMYDNDILKVLAAYNGGISNVNRWSQDQGDFIDNIDFNETKTYIEKVSTNKRFYDLLLDRFSFLLLDIPDSFTKIRINIINLYRGMTR